MNIEIKNLNNLTNDEKETLIRLAEKANKKSKVFKPKTNQPYYIVSAEGEIVDDIWEDLDWNNDMFNLGNCFETKEQAEFAIDKQKVYTELKRYALEHNEEEIDWNDIDKCKWCITKDCGKLNVYCFCRIHLLNQIYFTSEEIAQNAIKEIGEDRIKKYLFEVGE